MWPRLLLVARVFAFFSPWSQCLDDQRKLGMARVNTNAKVTQDPCWQPGVVEIIDADLESRFLHVSQFHHLSK